MQKDLTGKVAVITGASQGLGKAVAEHLSTLGADLVLLARHKDHLEAVAEQLRGNGSRVISVSCDISDAAQVQESAQYIVDEMDAVDILINNAGIPAPRSVPETDIADWDEVVGVNLSGAFYMTRALWETLIDSDAGYVINISGTMGLRGSGNPAYGSAKFGLTGLTRAIAASGKEHNLRATVLYPGGMDTGWRGAPIGEKPRTETMEPAEVARFIGYLLTRPYEFVINEAALNPLAEPLM